MAVATEPDALLKQAGALNRQEMRREQVPVFRTAMDPLMEEEARAVRDALGSDLETFIEDFYPDHFEAIMSTLLPVVHSYGEQVVGSALEDLDDPPDVDPTGFAEAYSEGLAGRWVSDSRGQIAHLSEDADEPEEAIEERTVRWEETRTQKMAEREATQSTSAFAKHAFLLAGVMELVWVSGPNACPLCAAMNGMTVSITGSFLEEGQELVAEAEGGERRLVTQQGIGHPPLHGMGGRGGTCDCTVAPR